MSQKTPTVAGKQLSSSLKERLKRCGRYHVSPRAETPLSKDLSCSGSEERPLKYENTAKKVCLRYENETIDCIKKNINPSITSSGGDNVDSVPVLKESVSLSKTCLPLSEIKRNQSVSQKSEPLLNQSENSRLWNPSILKNSHNKIAENVKHLSDCNSGCAKPNINDKAQENFVIRNKGLLDMGSPVLTRNDVDSSTTPVSSRIVKRSHLIRGSKIDFDKSETAGVELIPDNEAKNENTLTSKTKENVASLALTGNNSSDSAEIGDVTVAKTDKQQLGERTFRDRHSLLKDVSEKEEILRKLKMVRMYRTKNNLAELEELIVKWRSVAQQGLQDLHDALPEPKLSLIGLVQHLGIDHDLVGFDPLEETFKM